MANKRVLECGKEIFAYGAEGSIKDLSEKLKLCFECASFISCKSYINYVKLLSASLENLDYMAGKIKEEQNLY